MVENLLGAGGMGRVYRAKHRWLDTEVAIKVLNPLLDGDQEAVVRFQREARIAAQLNHPNIVKATDGGPIEGSFYLVTEFVDGIDLSDVVSHHGPLSVELACWLIRESAIALDHAHQAGLIHRDIKPSNIMLPKSGAPKLLDLGLARFADSATNLTSTGQFMGTIDYVSPEQAADTRAVDARSDIYSLGCTFYYLLTGRAPFEGQAYDSAVSKLLAHAEEEPISITDFRKDLPLALVKIVEASMAKEPSERIQSAGELAKQLTPFADGSSVQTLFAHQLTPAFRQNTIPTKQASMIDKMENISGSILDMLWIMFRTLLLAIGLLERVEKTSRSRLGSKPKFRYQISPGGLVAVLVVLGLIGFLYMSGFWIDFSSEPIE